MSGLSLTSNVSGSLSIRIDKQSARCHAEHPFLLGLPFGSVPYDVSLNVLDLFVIVITSMFSVGASQLHA